MTEPMTPVTAMTAPMKAPPFGMRDVLIARLDPDRDTQEAQQ